MPRGARSQTSSATSSARCRNDGPRVTVHADLVLAVDQGTSSTRAIAFDRSFRIVASASRALDTAYPRPGWVEQDPIDIVTSVVESVAEVLASVGGPERIVAVGLDNPGETVVAWDAATLEPLAPAVLWQCRRSEPIVERLRASGLEPEIRRRTGLPLEPYFSAGKAAWLLKHVPAVREASRRGALRFGTVDAWLTARLGDRGSLTDLSTASRTQLLSLPSGDWDDELIAWFGLDREMLPQIVPTVGDAGTLLHADWGAALPLAGLACDQQAALAGHGAFEPGAMKATYGTGVFVLANAGGTVEPAVGLERSIAWALPNRRATTVLQGGVFSAGALIDWLRDGLGLISDAEDAEVAARRAPDSAGVRVLPALAGLGAPSYDSHACCVIAGLTSAAGPDHVVRAALDGIAQRTADVVEAMVTALGKRPDAMRVDGGLTANGYLMERQADLLGMTIEVAAIEEATALGMAGLTAIGMGLASVDEVKLANQPLRRVEPRLSCAARLTDRSAWKQFVERARVL